MYKHNGTIKIHCSVSNGSIDEYGEQLGILGEGLTMEDALHDLVTKIQNEYRGGSRWFRQYYDDGSSINLQRAESCVPDTYPKTHGLLVLKWQYNTTWVVNEVYAIPRGTIVLGSLGEIVIGDQPAVRSGSEEKDPDLHLPEGSLRARQIGYAPPVHEWVPWSRLGIHGP